MTLNMYVPDHISLGWWFEIVEACVSGPWVKVYLLRIKENNKKTCKFCNYLHISSQGMQSIKILVISELDVLCTSSTLKFCLICSLVILVATSFSCSLSAKTLKEKFY